MKLYVTIFIFGWLWWFVRFSSAQDSECGQPEVPAIRIVHGELSLPGRWPWMAAIYLQHELKITVNTFICGGSLVGPRHILTAAHCPQVRSEINCSDCALSVRLGDFDLSRDDEPSSVQTFNVVEVREYPLYNDPFHDLAIMVLDGTPQISRYVMPLCLPPPSLRNDTFAGQNATMVGWGSTSYSDHSASNLQHQIQIPVWENDDCGRSYIESTINCSYICAGDEITRKNTFKGDSGGPLMVKYDGRWIEIGISSRAPSYESPYLPAVYTRVTEYIDWIEENILE